MFDNCGDHRLLEGNLANTRRFRVSLSLFLILTAVVPFAYAKDKERAWQDGILLDSSTEKGTRLVGNEYGVTTLRNDVMYYQIDSEKMAYVVARTLRSRRDKPLEVTINGNVQFAIDGSTCYLRDEKGKEHKLSVEKKIAK